MEYQCNLWRLFLKEMDEFISWIKDLEDKMTRLDWKRTEDYLPIVLIQNILQDKQDRLDSNGA